MSGDNLDELRRLAMGTINWADEYRAHTTEPHEMNDDELLARGVLALLERCERAERERDDYRARKDVAYDERNNLVAALARTAAASGCRAGIGKHTPDPDPAWDAEWLNVIYIETPAGQLSWHIHDRQLATFAGLPRIDIAWDGHTTDEKYARLARLEWPLAAQLASAQAALSEVERVITGHGPLLLRMRDEAARAEAERIAAWLESRPRDWRAERDHGVQNAPVENVAKMLAAGVRAGAHRGGKR